MFGKYKHTVDEKGRLFVPSKLREELGNTFYVTLGLDHCLSVYTESGWQAILDKYNALPIVQARKMSAATPQRAATTPTSAGRLRRRWPPARATGVSLSAPRASASPSPPTR